MRKWIGIGLLFLAFGQLGFRGMQRVQHNIPLWDFASVYAASRTWIGGGDPYDLPTVLDTWARTGMYAGRDVSYFATVYPPTSLVALIPFAIMPAGAALAGWLALTVMLLAVQFAALADMAKLTWRDGRLPILVGGALLTGAMQFGIISGQLSMPAISLCIIAFWCAGRDRERFAGILLGLACVIKPQVAGPFVLYYLAVRRFRLATWAIIVGGGIAAASLAAMQISQPHWIDGWRHSVELTTRIGGVNDYGWTGEFRDEIVDLKILIVGFIHNPSVQRVMVWGTVALLLGWYIRSFPRGVNRRDSRTELLALSVLAAIELLPVYHRVYDITLLTLALAWALAALDGPSPRRRYAVAMLVSMCLFLIPFSAARTIGKRLPAAAELFQVGWWQSTFALHSAWALLAVTIILLAAFSRQKGELGGEMHSDS